MDWDQFSRGAMKILKADIVRDTTVSRAWIRRSSQKGHHVILELSQDRFVFPDLWGLRFEYEDDLNRIRWDQGRNDPVGILFDWKRGHFSGDWERFKG